ncbi:MAG: ATP synthase F0 subunit C [Bryobacterales bacterium]|nr:ATP synthase F0 subunit C [Bryobacterales bacterium]
MKNKLMMLVALIMATPMFAQAQGGTTAAAGGLLGIWFAMALASGLCGLAQGKAIASAAEGVARNPGAGAQIQTLLLLGLAFIESLALFTFVIVLIK